MVKSCEWRVLFHEVPSAPYNRRPRAMPRYTEEVILWAESHGRCWRCKTPTMEIHHFVRGANRRKNDLRTMAMVCRECHDTEHRSAGIGFIGWLALKKRYDLEHCDIAAVVRMYRPNCKPEFVAEIKAAVETEYTKIVKDYP